MSCSREIRPVPIAPTLIRLLGASCPKTNAGTMVGKLLIASDEADPLEDVLHEDGVFIISLVMPECRDPDVSSVEILVPSGRIKICERRGIRLDLLLFIMVEGRQVVRQQRLNAGIQLFHKV